MPGLNTIDIAILCGGLGERLRSAIGESPKVMAEINHQPFLDFYLEQIKAQGFKRVVLLTGYKADVIEEYYKKNSKGLTIEFSTENEPLGTGGAIKNAERMIQSETFLVLNGDSYFPAEHFAALIQFHHMKKALASIIVTRVTDAKDFGSIRLSPDSKISSFEEKISGESFVNAGVYCFQKEILPRMPQANKFSIEKEFFPALTKEAFYGFEVNDSFVDIGTPERYKKAQDQLRKGTSRG